MESGIYETVNTTNGKRYIGSATDLEKRKGQHWNALRGGYHVNRYLQNAWNKYGEDAFEFNVLHILYPENLIAIEQGEIDTKSEYNISKVAGSNLGVKHTAEAKANMSKAAKKRPLPTPEARAKMSRAQMGYKQTDEHKANISAALMGHEVTDETRAKITKANTGFRGKHTDEARAQISKALMGNTRSLGYKHTDETKTKMAKAQKKRWAREKRL